MTTRISSNESKSGFAGVREVRAALTEGARDTTDVVGAALLECQKGGAPHSALGCLGCSRFLDYHPGPGPYQITIHCCWSSMDLVGSLMTRSSSLVAVAPGASIQTAEELAEQSGVRHLVVLSGQDLVGVVCRCDLIEPHRPGETVGDRMRTTTLTVSPTDTLGDVAALMRLHHVGCLPVVGEGLLLGVITRGDLRRVGAPERLLATDHCAACGSVHGVLADERSGVDLCLDCLARAHETCECDLGEGD